MTALLDTPVTVPAPTPAPAPVPGSEPTPTPVSLVSGVPGGFGTLGTLPPVVFEAAHLDDRRPVQPEDTAQVTVRFPIDLDHVAGMLWHLIDAGYTLADLDGFTTADLLAAFLADGMMAAVEGDAALSAIGPTHPAHELAVTVTLMACELFSTGRAGEHS